MKPIASIVLKIKGREWTFLLLHDKAFIKIHGDDAMAMTIPGKYEVHFRKSDWSTVAIKHEIGHILHFASLVSSSEMSTEDIVELMCEIIGEHCEEIILWTNRVVERFLNH